MRRANGKALGTWAIVAVLAATLVGFIVPGGLALHAPTAQTPTGPALAPTSSHATTLVVAPPLVRAAANNSSPPIEASATITSTYSGPQDVPVAVSWDISVSNVTLNALNVSMSLLVTNGADEVANLSQPVATNTTSYSTMVDYAALTSENYLGGNLPTTPYTFTVWVTVLNVSNGSVPWVNASSAPVTATLSIENVGVLITSSVPLYSQLPFQFTIKTTYTGNTGATLDAGNASLSLELRFIESGCYSILGLGAPCESVANNTLEFNASNLTGGYTLTLSLGNFTADNFANGQLPLGEYQVIVWNTYSNSSDPNEEARTAADAAYLYPVFDANSATFLSPSPLKSATIGNVTLAVKYFADYLSGANLTVYAGTKTSGTVIFSAGAFDAGLAIHAASAYWLVPTPGEYTVVLTILTSAGAAAGQATFQETFNLTTVAGGGTVYYNTTTWENTTTTGNSGIGGLSPGVAAAVLLVAGLIVGMIVAMLLGRMMWTSASPTPAQPWSGSKGANECTVCHQSFPSEGELKEHQKQAHGMG